MCIIMNVKDIENRKTGENKDRMIERHMMEREREIFIEMHKKGQTLNIMLCK